MPRVTRWWMRYIQEEKKIPREEDETIINEEEEEKPLTPPTTMASENTHGGNEATKSIDDGMSRGGVQVQPQADFEGESPVASTNTAVSTSSTASAENTSNSDGYEGAEEEDAVRGTNNTINSNDVDLVDADIDNTGADSGDSTSSTDGVEGEIEYDEIDGIYEGDDAYGEETEEQMDSFGEKNTIEVVDLHDPRSSLLYYQTEFYRFIEKISEVDLNTWSYDDFDKYNIKKLMFRQYEKRPLSYYRGTNEKDTVVLILDNSGSMTWWASELEVLARLAMDRNDIELYIAPNGLIQEKWDGKQWIPVDHAKVLRGLQGRTVIYVGDYDGADTAVELSWVSNVIWVCPESRYKHFRSHDWVHYSESDFKGIFIRAWNIIEMLQGFKRIINPYGRQWIDFHENDEYHDT